jgi:hypothetical protein
MENTAMIVVSLPEGPDGLNIVSKAVGLGNGKDLTDGTFAVGR